MGASVAKIEANRKNARKSTGPKTVEGKAKARANALKHGLTGAGIALPIEDQAKVEDRLLALQEEMRPSDLAGRLLVHTVALMSVRVERSARHETAALSLRVRHAEEEFELARFGEIDRLFHSIETDAPAIRRRLLTTEEGVDKLVGAMRSIRHQLVSGIFRGWDQAKRQ